MQLRGTQDTALVDRVCQEAAWPNSAIPLRVSLCTHFHMRDPPASPAPCRNPRVSPGQNLKELQDCRVCSGWKFKSFAREICPFTFSPALRARACQSHPRPLLSTTHFFCPQRVADGSWGPDSHLPNGLMKPTAAACLSRYNTTASLAHLVNRVPLSCPSGEPPTSSSVHHVCCT